MTNERLSFLTLSLSVQEIRYQYWYLFLSLTIYLFRSKIEELIEGLCLVQSTLSSSCNVPKDDEKSSISGVICPDVLWTTIGT